jgi:hypothetical protein
MEKLTLSKTRSKIFITPMGDEIKVERWHNDNRLETFYILKKQMKNFLDNRSKEGYKMKSK